MKPIFKIIFSIIGCINISLCVAQKNVKLNLIDNRTMIEILNKNKIEFQQSDLAFLKDLKSFINYSKKKLIVPDYFIFNKEGYLVNQGLDKEECNSLIRTFDHKLFRTDETETLESFIKEIEFIDKDQEFKDKEFVVFITWANFAHKNSNEESFDNFSYIKKKYGNNVRVFLLNLDVNTSWNLTEKQKQLLKL